MENLVDKWEQTGLLDGSEGYARTLIAENLEKCGNAISKRIGTNFSKDTLQDIANTIFPIVVVLYREHDVDDIDAEHLFSALNDDFNDPSLYELFFTDAGEYVKNFISRYIATL